MEAGLVASPAHPAGNVTGISSQSGNLAGKNLQLSREAVPGVRPRASGRRMGVATTSVPVTPCLIA